MKSFESISYRLLGGSIGAALLVAFAGCGNSIPTRSSSAPPPPETGSNTLLVEAGIVGSDSPSHAFVTDYSATVRDAHGAAVSGATVVLTTPNGTVQLLEPPGTTGTYRYASSDYVPGTYFLTILRGSDRLSGTHVLAPAIHQIVSPAAYDTVAAGSALEVDWSFTEPTDEVLVETLDFNDALAGDAGVTTIPPSGNPPRDDQRIRVIRSNSSAVTGGLAGSRLTASIRTTVEPVIVR